MAGFPIPFGGPSDDAATFDEYGEFVPAHLPDAGEFLAGHDVLVSDEHVAVHETARDLFEERGVYDMTFDYNLARLNLDSRHADAGFRYAEETDDAMLRAEFTPTTVFCPQTLTLTIGAFRAWNGLSEQHDYDLVQIRTVESHHQSESVNETLRMLEAEYRQTGSVPGDAESEGTDTAPGGVPDAPF